MFARYYYHVSTKFSYSGLLDIADTMEISLATPTEHRRHRLNLTP